MKKMYYIDTTETLRKCDKFKYQYGRYKVGYGCNNLYIGRKCDNERLIYTQDTSFHEDLGYDEILYNFINDNRNIKNFVGKRGVSNYAICKNGEVITDFEDLISKDIRFTKKYLQEEANKNYNGLIEKIDEDIKMDIIVKSYKYNPYRDPYFISKDIYDALLCIIDFIVLKDEG